MPTWIQFPVFRIRAQVQEIEPAIWRTFEVSERVPLPLLHRALQASFEWKDYHLHEFRVGRLAFGPIHSDAPAHLIDESPLIVGQLVRRKTDEIEYAYDFGDDWHVTLTVEEVVEASDPTAVILRCLDGRRAGPPEDCGGTHGYANFLEAFLIPTHADHEQMRDWIGKAFDPEACNPAAINRAIDRDFRALSGTRRRKSRS